MNATLDAAELARIKKLLKANGLAVAPLPATRNQYSYKELEKWVDEYCEPKAPKAAREIRRDILSVIVASAGDFTPPSKAKLRKLVDDYEPRVKRNLKGYKEDSRGYQDRKRWLCELMESTGYDISPAPVEREIAKLELPWKREEYRKVVKDFIGWITRRKAEALPSLTFDTVAIERGLANLKQSGKAPGTCHLRLVAVRKFCKWASNPSRRYFPADPSGPIRATRKDCAPVMISKALPEGDFENLITATQSGAEIGGYASVDRAAIYRTLACSGIELTEAEPLKVGEFDLIGDRPLVRIGERKVPILPKTEAANLAIYFKGKDRRSPAFPPGFRDAGSDDQRSNTRIGKWLRDDLKRAGILPPDHVATRRGSGLLNLESLQLLYCVRAKDTGATVDELQVWLGRKVRSTLIDKLRKVLTESEIADMSRLIERPVKTISAVTTNTPTTLQKGNAKSAIKGTIGRPSKRHEFEPIWKLLAKSGLTPKEFSEKDPSTYPYPKVLAAYRWGSKLRKSVVLN